MPEKLMSVISPAGLLFTSGFVGRAAGGGSKFESVEWELKEKFEDELKFGTGFDPGDPGP